MYGFSPTPAQIVNQLEYLFLYSKISSRSDVTYARIPQAAAAQVAAALAGGGRGHPEGEELAVRYTEAEAYL